MRLESILQLLNPNYSTGSETLYFQGDTRQPMLYTGSLTNGMRNGYGEMKYFYLNADNDLEFIAEFKGEWKDNSRHGKGVIFGKDQKKQFEGIFQNDNFFNGFGTLFFSNRTIQFQGDFLNGKRHGKGTEFDRFGNKIKEGTWNDNNFVDGISFHYYPSGNLKYEGIENSMGKPHGQGTSFDDNGIIEYSGEYKNGKKWGHGTMYRKGILQYIGNFKNDKPHGLGILFYQTMVPCFEGKFVNNEIFGTGKLYYSSGNLHKTGFFKFGRLSGKGCVYDKDGTTVLEKGKYVHDQLVDEHLFSVQKYLETKDPQFLSKVPKDYLKKYIFEKFHTKVAFNKNKSYMVSFLNELYQNQKQKEVPMEEDLFGNIISKPCRGSDGAIYDLESMNYLFEKNSDGDYKNIPYIYNEANERVPSFPRMSNGNRLTSFVLLDEN